MCWGVVVLVVEDVGPVVVELGEEVCVEIGGLVVVAVVLELVGWTVVVVGGLARVVVVGGLGAVVVVERWCDTVEVVAAEADPIVRASELHTARTAPATTNARRGGSSFTPAGMRRYEPPPATPHTRIAPDLSAACANRQSGSS